MMFSGQDLNDELQRRRTAAAKDVRNANEDYVIGVNEDDWLEYLCDQYGIDIPKVHPDQATHVASSHVQRTPTGTTLSATVRIPFTGRPELFEFSPNIYGPPKPDLRTDGQDLVKTISFPHTQPPDFTQLPFRLAAEVERFLAHAASQADQHNTHLRNELRGLISEERRRLIEARAALNALPIPVEERPDAPTTYTAPGITRRPAPELPQPKAGKPLAIEPELATDFYEHIIEVIRSAGLAIERTPGTFAKGSETQKRDVLLVMLNSHYQGAAAGEVFNGAGKADIVLRFADHNLLVAECKFWNGRKVLEGALGQIEGYITLRDTRAALIIFVRSKEPMKAVAEARTFFTDLDRAEIVTGGSTETDFRVRLNSAGGADRSALVHVLFFHTPRE